MRCEDFRRLTELCELAISPDGTKVAYVLRSCAEDVGRFTFELFVASVEDGASRETSRLGVGLRAPTWSPDGRRLAMLETAGNGDSATLSVYGVADGSLWEHPSRFVHASHLRWMPGGKGVALLEVEADALGSRSGDAPFRARGLTQLYDGYGTAASFRRRIVEVELETGEVRELVGGDVFVDSFTCAADGTLAYCAATDVSHSLFEPNQPGTVRPLALFLKRHEGSAPRQLTAPERAARAPVFSSDGSEVLFLGLRRFAPGLLRLYSVSLEGGSERLLVPDFDRGIVSGGGYGDGALFPMSSESTVFAARDRGSFKVFRTDPDVGVSPVAGSESESTRHLTAAVVGRRLAYVSTDSAGAQGIRVTDLAGAEVCTLPTRSAPSGLRPLVPLEFTARDGAVLPGWLIEGSGEKDHPKPLLVDVHGGSFSGAWAAQPDLSRLYQQELAERGFHILLLNARGSDGYGEEYATAAAGRWGIADAPDFHDAIDHLVETGVCSGQVAVTGYSYGGFMANWLTATSDRFAASVSGGSICDFVSLYGTSDMGVPLTELDAGVEPLAAPEAALERSPISRARRVRTPTLLLHGAADLRCPIGQAEEWFAALARAGCVVELVRYPGASHGFLSDGPPSYVVDYGRRLVEWVSGALCPEGRLFARSNTLEASP